MMLAAELDRYRRSSGIVTRSTSPLDSLRENPVTLSQELFSSQDPRKAMDEILRTSPHATVNPASLSPSLTPVDDSSEAVLKQEPSMEANTSEQTSSNSPVSTQHPAAMLTDLPCQTSAELPKSFLESQTSMPPTLVWLLQLQMMQLSASAILSFCQRPLTQIAASLKAGSSLLPTPQLLATIIWLVTLPRSTSTTTSTSANSSTRTETMSQNLWQRAISPQQTTATSPSTTTLRLKSLRKILSCSPSLARPLSDATLVALRLVSKGSEDQAEVLRRGTVESRGDDELTRCLSNMALPSKELLMTLLWSIRMEEQRIRRKAARGASLDSETRSPEQGNQQARKTVLRALPNRQSRLAGMGRGGTRRTRRS
ncbi:hypothetical protein NM208_g15266 [Fusarium decemcellulare]|uniref:Uncharacterized protein n=1 Tax=Fusarium decemcellulare TaxID=57161 RepID=A0ACC1RH04_9HYPO|nr:hypothetical protein NM208_g15266 [Fusarium decemcellulare]